MTNMLGPITMTLTDPVLHGSSNLSRWIQFPSQSLDWCLLNQSYRQD